MKKLLLLSIFAVFSLVANAQNENDGTYEHFICVDIEWGGSVSKKPYIPLVSIENEKEDYIYDVDGEKIKFASRSALINYFIKLGWFFVQDVNGKSNDVGYVIFKKIVKNEQEAKKGILFKDDIKKK